MNSCNIFECDPAICDDSGTPKGQCSNCGCMEHEHDITLFNKYSACNDIGNSLTKDFNDLISEFVKFAMDKYNPIDVEHILTSTLHVLCSEYRIMNAIKMRKNNE